MPEPEPPASVAHAQGCVMDGQGGTDACRCPLPDFPILDEASVACTCGLPKQRFHREGCALLALWRSRREQRGASSPPSPSVTTTAPTYGAVTGGNGRYVLPCGCVPPCEGHHEDES